MKVCVSWRNFKMTKCLYVQILALLFSNSAFAKARVDAPLKIAIIQSKSEELKTLNKEFKEGVIIAMEQAAKAIPKLAKLVKVHEITLEKTSNNYKKPLKELLLATALM